MDTGMEPLKKIIEVIGSNERFILLGHKSPDGDSLCSQLALQECLDLMGKTSSVVSIDPVPERYRFLPGYERLNVTPVIEGDFHVAFILECSELERTGYKDLSRFYTVNIDHHLQNSQYADCNWVDPKACAVGEMIFDLAKALDLQINRTIATNLYTSIITDTGSFHYSNTSKRTFEICAELLDTGISPSHIAKEIYENEPLRKFKLLAKILLSIETDPTGEIAWFFLTQDELERGENECTDTEGLIDFTRAIRGVRVVIFLREIGRDTFKVSLRSKDETNVAELARRFGGGGHRNASGCVLRGSRSEVLNTILEKLASLSKS